MATATNLQIAYLEPSDLDEAYQISLDAFSQDAHTLFKMYEKGSTDMRGEMLPKEEIGSYLDRPEKVKVIKAMVEDKIAGFSIWGLWNWEGQKKDVCTRLSLRLLELTGCRSQQTALVPRCRILSKPLTLQPKHL
jgi:hypothetical protein